MGRRRKGEPPKYRRHHGGQAFCIVDNETHWLGPADSPQSRKRYARLCAELASSGTAPAVNPAAELTINELAAAWAGAQHAASAAEKARYQISIDAVTDLYGDTPAVAFGPRALKAVRQQMIAAGLGRSTINQRVGRIKRWLRWAVSDELVPESVWRSCCAVENLRAGSDAPEPRKVPPVPDAVVDATLSFCSANLAAMIRLHRLTGMRSGNLCSLTPADILRPAAGAPWFYRPAKHRSAHRGKSIVIVFGPQAVDVLRPLLDGPADAPLFSPRKSVEDRKRGKPGLRWTSDGYCHAVENAVKRARESLCPIDDWHPHQLRHSRATVIRDRFGVESARDALGHAHISMTEVYAEKSLAAAVRVAMELG